MVAIAIPAFGGQLENAKLQTDHANIRSAYAVYMTATLDGNLYVKDATGKDTVVQANATGMGSKKYYFSNLGEVTEKTDNIYLLKAKGNTDACASSIGCSVAGSHEVGKAIEISWDSTSGGFLKFKFVSPPTTPGS